VTCVVYAGIKADFVMESFDVDASALAVVVVLVSLARLVQVLFATLRICFQEYYSFRKWLVELRRDRGSDP
jgi:hypothetical protein